MSDGYDFSPSYHASLVSYSPGTTFLATVYQNRVIIRSTSTLQIVRTWSCNQPSSIASTSRDIQEQVKIDSVEWSEDGLYILAFSSSIKTAWVFALATNGDGDSGEIAKIGGEGVEGLIKVEWGRSGKTILAWSDFNLKLSIFDLSSGITRIIQNPKSHLQCHTYSSDNRYMAIVEKHLGKEFIGIYDVLDNHHLVRHFQLSTSDVQGMSWSPDGKYLAVWDSALSYSIYIYSPIGPLLSHFTHTSLTFSPESLSEDPGLGIRTVTWAPGGRWLAIGGWDGKVRILESTGWRCIALLNNPSRITEKDVTVWKEPQDWVKDTRGHGIVQFDRMQCPAAIPNSRPDLSKVNPNMGISQISFDKDGALFAVCSESTPNALHIYTFLKSPTAEGPEISHLTTLLFANLVKTVMWCPGTKGRKLAVTAKSQALYLWDEEGNWEEENTKETGQLSVGIEKGGVMEGICIPSRSNFSAVDLQWAPDGSSLVLQDKSQFCLLYDNDSDTNQVTLDRSGMWTPAGEGLSHVMEEEEYEDGWSGYGLNLRQGFSSGIPA